MNKKPFSITYQPLPNLQKELLYQDETYIVIKTSLNVSGPFKGVFLRSNVKHCYSAWGTPAVNYSVNSIINDSLFGLMGSQLESSTDETQEWFYAIKIMTKQIINAAFPESLDAKQIGPYLILDTIECPTIDEVPKKE